MHFLIFYNDSNSEAKLQSLCLIIINDQIQNNDLVHLFSFPFLSK